LVRRSHYAVGHFLGCVVFLERTTLATVKRTANPLVELGLPSSITQQYLADRPQSIDSSLGLSFPSAHQEPQVHLTRVLPSRYVPSSGFGYPLDGFLPAVPCRFCFAPAALLGFTLRSFLLPEGIRPVSEPKNPHTVSLSVYPRRSTGRLDRPQFLGFAPSGSPWQPNVLLARRPLDAPLGFASLGLPRIPWPGFRPASSHALFRSGLIHPGGGASEFRSASAPPQPPLR